MKKRDPDGAVLAFGYDEETITMPARLMDDGQHKARTGNLLRVCSRSGTIRCIYGG